MRNLNKWWDTVDIPIYICIYIYGTQILVIKKKSQKFFCPLLPFNEKHHLAFHLNVFFPNLPCLSFLNFPCCPSFFCFPCRSPPLLASSFPALSFLFWSLLGTDWKVMTFLQQVQASNLMPRSGASNVVPARTTWVARQCVDIVIWKLGFKNANAGSYCETSLTWPVWKWKSSI